MNLFPFDRRARNWTLLVEVILITVLFLGLFIMVMREGLKNEKLARTGSCLDIQHAEEALDGKAEMNNILEIKHNMKLLINPFQGEIVTSPPLPQEYQATNLVLQRMYEFYFRPRVEKDFVWSPTGFYKVCILLIK